MANGGMSIEGMFANIERSFTELRRLPELAIADAEKTLMIEAPVYTGTLKDAIELHHGTLGDNSFEIALTEGMLRMSAGENAMRFSRMKVQRGILDQSGDVEFAYAATGRHGVNDAELAAAYIYENVHELPPDGLYPYRIERYGGPKTGEGKGMWEHAAEAARDEIRKQMQGIAQRASK